MENYLKKDLLKTIILVLVVVLVLVSLAILDNKTGFLGNLASKYF